MKVRQKRERERETVECKIYTSDNAPMRADRSPVSSLIGLPSRLLLANRPGRFQGGFKTVSKRFQNRFKAIKGQSRGNSQEVSERFQNSFKPISGRFQGGFRAVSERFQANQGAILGEISKDPQCGLRTVSERFQSGFKAVSKRFITT